MAERKNKERRRKDPPVACISILQFFSIHSLLPFLRCPALVSPLLSSSWRFLHHSRQGLCKITFASLVSSFSSSRALHPSRRGLPLRSDPITLLEAELKAPNAYPLIHRPYLSSISSPVFQQQHYLLAYGTIGGNTGSLTPC